MVPLPTALPSTPCAAVRIQSVQEWPMDADITETPEMDDDGKLLAQERETTDMPDQPHESSWGIVTALKACVLVSRTCV